MSIWVLSKRAMFVRGRLAPPRDEGPSALKLKVLGRFDAAGAAAKCAQALHGKQFDGRGVRATFVPEATFSAHAIRTADCMIGPATLTRVLVLSTGS